MEHKVTVSDIADMLKADPERYASLILGLQPTARSATSVRYYENQSLVVNTAGQYRGIFHSFKDADASGNMIELIRWHNALGNDKSGFLKALDIARELLGISGKPVGSESMPPVKSDEELQREIEKDLNHRINIANWIWNSSDSELGKDAGLAYLEKRGIVCEIPPDILKFRTLSPEDLSKMHVPAKDIPETPVVSLVFAARNGSGDITAVQQVLTTNGKKVKFRNPKRTNGYIPGSCVTIGDTSGVDRIAMAEGPETALSVYQATHIPTLITFGSSNFAKAHFPDHVKELIIVSDLEKSGVGIGSALKAAQEWKRKGVERVGIAIPSDVDEGDCNDILLQYGENKVRECIDSAFFAPENNFEGAIVFTADPRAAFCAWARTGIEVATRVPARDREGNLRPVNLDKHVHGRHERVAIVENPLVEINDKWLRAARPDIEIVRVEQNAGEFRKLANVQNGIENSLRKALRQTA